MKLHFQIEEIIDHLSDRNTWFYTIYRTLHIGKTKLGQHFGDMTCQIADADVFEMDIWGGNVGCALLGWEDEEVDPYTRSALDNAISSWYY